jgi:hypothetical protein
VFGVVSMPRLVAIVVLGIVALAGRDWAPIALATAALVILAGVSVWDARTERDLTYLTMHERTA